MSRPETWSDLRWFKRGEFDYPELMNDATLLKLDKARTYAGIPIVITDGWRPDDPNSDSAHEYGLAVDIRCHTSGNRWLIAFALKEAGFRRIGLYDRHIHADTDPDKPQAVLWLGKSA